MTNPIKITPNEVQKFVLVETNQGLCVWGDPSATWHKDIVQQVSDAGLEVKDVLGGGKLKMTSTNIYVWGKSTRYGNFSFEKVSDVLKNNFPEIRIVNEEPLE